MLGQVGRNPKFWNHRNCTGEEKIPSLNMACASQHIELELTRATWAVSMSNFDGIVSVGHRGHLRFLLIHVYHRTDQGAYDEHN